MDDAQYSQAALVQLRGAVQNHFEQAMQRQPGAMQCKEGCSGCCRPGLSVFGLEAAKIRESLAALSQNAPAIRDTVRRQGHLAVQDPGSVSRCPLLVDDRCAVYHERPLICRSHGLPILSDPQGPVRNCELNYQEQAAVPASVLRLDAINLPLGVSAELWHQSTKTPLRESLADLAAQSSDDPSSAS